MALELRADNVEKPVPSPASPESAPASLSTVNRSKQKRSFRETIQHVWNNITLEPLVICFVMPSMLLMLGSSNLNLEKACRVNLGYTQTVCDALTKRQTANYTL